MNPWVDGDVSGRSAGALLGSCEARAFAAGACFPLSPTRGEQGGTGKGGRGF